MTQNNILKISDTFSLPTDAVSQTFAILARKRSGKTYTASVIAEEMVYNKIPFVVLDPTGAWWGLRSGKDGMPKGGLPVYVIGGAHGIPLESTAGKVIADQVVEHPSYYVIDLSGFSSNAEQDRFATDFGERLYRAKDKHRFPMHLFIDEADSFAPQKPMPNQMRMLGAYEALVRRGGIKGIGITMITQRPAVINKNILSQLECLMVLQMTSPHDQDAIEDWVKRNGTEERKKTLMSSLASLGKGECWIWSPAWLDIFKKVQIRERHTYNSSATPEYGSKNVQPILKPINLDKLSEQIRATAERVKESDPEILKRKIRELQDKLSRADKQHEQDAKRVAPSNKDSRRDIKFIQTHLAKAQKLAEQVTEFMKRLTTELAVPPHLMDRVPENYSSMDRQKTVIGQRIYNRRGELIEEIKFNPIQNNKTSNQ